MPLLLDSANKNDVIRALDLGVVSGITTNPKLISDCDENPSRRIKELISEVPLQIWIQVPEGEHETMLHWCLAHWSFAPERIVIKIPCTWEGIKLAKALKVKKVKVCVTSIFSASQALAAFHAGADFVAIYVNRATRKGIDGIKLVKEVAEVIQAGGGRGKILAASLKNPQEMVDAYVAGAGYLTAPFDVLHDLLTSSLTEEALQGFRQLPGGTI
jgi:transaldolase